jgi:hypothetical protein
MRTMKIFLTDFDAYGATFAGPNIIAETFEKADEAAAKNGLIVVGELDSIYVDESDTAHGNVIPLKQDRTIH